MELASKWLATVSPGTIPTALTASPHSVRWHQDGFQTLSTRKWEMHWSSGWFQGTATWCPSNRTSGCWVMASPTFGSSAMLEIFPYHAQGWGQVRERCTVIVGAFCYEWLYKQVWGSWAVGQGLWPSLLPGCSCFPETILSFQSLLGLLYGNVVVLDLKSLGTSRCLNLFRFLAIREI